MFTWAFWKATLERSVSTAAQFAVTAWGGGALPEVSLPWWTIPAAAGAGFALSVLKAVAAGAATGGGPSLTNSEKLT